MKDKLRTKKLKIMCKNLKKKMQTNIKVNSQEEMNEKVKKKITRYIKTKNRIEETY